MLRKQFDITVKEQRENGGRILINTAAVDRDRDRVMPLGARIENYLKNPVVMWGHNYRDPFALIGKTNELTITEAGIEVDFDLRPAANEADPQNIVLLLWNGGWVRTSSIGFDPRDVPVDGVVPTEDDGVLIEARGWTENEHGGFDYTDWELLEWSLVPIPANQEALRLAVKGLGEGEETRRQGDKETEPVGGGDVAWIRRLTVESDKGEQVLFACFRSYQIEFAEDAEKLDFDEDGEIVLVPHPDAGTTVDFKEVNFVPPIAYTCEKWGDDATYSIGGPSKADDELIKSWGDEWQVRELSDVLLSLPRVKGWRGMLATAHLDVCRLTQRAVAAVKDLIGKQDREDGADSSGDNVPCAHCGRGGDGAGSGSEGIGGVEPDGQSAEANNGDDDELTPEAIAVFEEMAQVFEDYLVDEQDQTNNQEG